MNVKGAKMKLLVFGWRCLKHPRAGGSETYIFNIMKRIRENFDRVMFFTSHFSGAPRRETIDGIEIIRYGYDYSPITISLYAKFVLNKEALKDAVIIENINHVPFFSPLLFRGVTTIGIIHHIGMMQLYEEAPKPVAVCVDFVERKLTPRLYNKIPIITVSESSKRTLKSLGYYRVHVVPPGIDYEKLRSMSQGYVKENALILYFGRIMKYKRVHDVIKAFSLLKRRIPEAKLCIAGRISSPHYFSWLKSLVRKLGLVNSVIFLGEVSEEEKAAILAKAQILVTTSVMEGWGITVIEANACGTPVVAYDVPGLRDSIKHMTTGILVPQGDTKALAQTIFKILMNNKLREKMSENALKYAEKLTWERTAKAFMEILEKIIDM